MVLEALTRDEKNIHSAVLILHLDKDILTEKKVCFQDRYLSKIRNTEKIRKINELWVVMLDSLNEQERFTSERLTKQVFIKIHHTGAW